jgi:hypothetical protein
MYREQRWFDVQFAYDMSVPTPRISNRNAADAAP